MVGVPLRPPIDMTCRLMVHSILLKSEKQITMCKVRVHPQLIINNHVLMISELQFPVLCPSPHFSGLHQVVLIYMYVIVICSLLIKRSIRYVCSHQIMDKSRKVIDKHLESYSKFKKYMYTEAQYRLSRWYSRLFTKITDIQGFIRISSPLSTIIVFLS